MKRPFTMPEGLSHWELDRLAVRFQYALGNLLESTSRIEDAMSKDAIQKQWLGKPSKDFWCIGGPQNRRFSEALIALRKTKVPKRFIQELFDACHKVEHATISRHQANGWNRRSYPSND
jgi:hypothetical protein